MYEYKCQLIQIINGNTIEAFIDLGFDISIRMNIKIFGVVQDENAKLALASILPKTFICKTVYNKRGKTGRILGHLYHETESGERININEVMIAQGFELKNS